MDYFYVPPGKISPDSVTIEGEEYNHLVHVMRKKEGEVVRVVDGFGTAYDVTISSLKQRTAVGLITGRYPSHNEPSVRVTAAVGLLKNPSKFDFVVEKLTELGVREIVPLRTERTIPLAAKSTRWHKLALAAMKQCGRAFLPSIGETMSLIDFLSQFSIQSQHLAVVCHESVNDAVPLSRLIASKKKLLDEAGSSALILIGSEGGFTAQEIVACIDAGCSVGSLGPRRLRTETAAICAASLLLIP